MAKAIPIPVVQVGFEQSIEAGKRAAGTINLPVNIDPSAFKNLNQPLGKITGLATEFEKSIAASNARVLAFGASVGILNAVSQAFKSILDNGIAVEKALADIGSVSGQSAAQLDQLGDALFNVAKNTSQSFGVAAKAALEFSRQGLSVEETVKRTNDALTLTRFTSLNAADAVDTLTAAVNSFAGAGITTTQILNKLIAVDSAFAVSAEDLANGLARAGSIAQEVGVTFDELNGLITVAQERTARGGSVIGNALKTIFTRIRSDETINALRAVGVESLDTAGNLRDVVPILTDLSVKLKDLSGGERIQILEAVASKYNINILSALLGDIGNAQGQFSKALGVSLGASNEAFARQVELNKTLDAVLNQSAVSAGELANNLAKIGLNDNLKSLVGYVNSFLDSINKLLSSTDAGGDLARGIIKGFSDVLFKVGLPIIAAIFVKLTRDIAVFGVESLQTILGINQKVKERQALEQAVTNTLISNKSIMDQILASSGNRVKQEQILLDAYNKQIQALSTIQSISASVTPALQGAGLTATARGVTKKAAGGYLPSQEAADVRRGVGGASSSSKVVSIPNFAFGGGKKGTMIANTSEYVVPNFANGGSAIFNQDMVKAYGLPAGAKKIGAAGGYIPNFAKYIYDSDRIPADKNATLKAILASSAKKNLLIAPAGAGKSTLAAGMGKFLTGAGDVANATEIDILSGAGRTKDGGLSKNLESIMAAVNASGGKVSYLYTKNFDILSRRGGRINPSEGDLRSKKQLAGTNYAPLNQFDFMGMLKSRSSSFQMMRGAEGFVPNFADLNDTERFAALIGKKSGSDSGLLNRYSLWASQDSQGKVQVSDIAKPTSGDEQNGKLIKFNAYGVPSKSDKQLTDVKEQLSEYGKNSAVQLARNMTSEALPSDFIQGKLAATFNPGSLSSFAGTIFEASVGALLGDKSFKDYSEQAVTSAFDLDVRSNQNIKRDFKIPNNVDFLEVKGSDSPPLIKSIAKKIYQVTELNRAAVSKRKIGNTELKQLGMQRPLSDLDKLIVIENGKTNQFSSRKELEDYVSSKYTKNVGNSTVAGGPKFSENVWPSIGPRTKRGATGYIPNFAEGGPLEDAIQREMAAGLDPSQIRVTKDGRLKNSRNPDGFAVINTRDEPDGKVPNFANVSRKGIKKLLGRSPNPIDTSPYTGGQNFDYGVASAQANQQPIKSQGPQEDLEGKTLLTTNKLLAAFSLLTITTQTLQNTVGRTNEGFGKVLTTISQVGAGAASGGFAGSIAKDALGSRLSTLGSFGKGVLKNLPLVGALAGGAFEAYSSYQQNKQAEKNVALTGANEAVNKEITSIQATSGSPEEIKERIKALELEKDKIAENFDAVRDGEIAAKKATLEKERNDSSQIFKSGGQQERDQAQAKILEIEEELSKLSSTRETDKAAADQQAIAATTALFQLTKAEEEAATRRTKEEAKATEELVKRVALTTQLNSLTEAFADGQNKALIQRAEREASFIKNAATLNQYQRQEQANKLELLSIDDKISDSKKSILESTVKELAKASLGTVEQEALDNLRKTIESGKENLNIEEELTKLKIDNNSQAGITIKNALTQERIQENSLIAEKKALKIKQQIKKEEQERNEVNRIALQTINDRVSAEKQLRDTRTSGGRAIEDVRLQTDAIALQNQISKQPFATREQEAQLARINAEIARQTEIRSIDRAQQDAQISSFDGLKSSYAEQVKSLGFLTDAQQEEIQSKVASAKTAEDLQKVFNSSYFLTFQSQDQNDQYYAGLEKINAATALSIEQLKNANQLRDIQIKQLAERNTYELALINLREKSPAQAGAIRAITDINKEASSFAETFSYNTTIGFRDGLRDALSAAVSGTDDLRGALQGVAQGFLKTMQQAFLQNASNNVLSGLSKTLPNFFQMPVTKSQGGYIQKFANGGFVTGGSGIRDDVPAMLSSGEYVMRKSAVQKYGAENMAKMNNGGIFLPGVRGGSAISGYDQLSKFANQTTTSGATDVLRGSKSTAFANLEDQSARLSRFGLMNEDTIKGEIASAQQQGLELIAQREAYRTQQRKAMQQQIVGTVAAAGLSYGVGKIGDIANKMTVKSNVVSGQTMMTPYRVQANRIRKAYGGMIAGFNNGGGPTDDIPALLMGGEYVMDRATVRKYGKQYLDSMNTGRARFAEGGYAGAETETTTESNDSKAKVNAATGTAVNISINVSGSSSSTESQGQTSQGGVDYKKMGERIKAVVLETINEEKRLGGALRSR